MEASEKDIGMTDECEEDVNDWVKWKLKTKVTDHKYMVEKTKGKKDSFAELYLKLTTKE